ncbi:hypothetical protein DIPPA_19722 [Diplonema papillatum]|nr:hypothetical protein DIPPA_19722 [Diplonema papillatum]
MKPASNAEIIQDRKEAFGMFSANGMLPGCELLVALQAAGLRHVDAAKAQAAKQRHWPGTEPLSFPGFSKLCDCFSGTAIPLAQPFQAASKPHLNQHANVGAPSASLTSNCYFCYSCAVYRYRLLLHIKCKLQNTAQLLLTEVT